MIFDDEDKCIQLAYRVLEHYRASLGRDCALRLLQLSENVTYLVEKRGSGKIAAVLRLCRPGYREPAQLEAELAWLRELHQCSRAKEAEALQVIFRCPVAGDDGRDLCAVRDQTGQVYYGTVFSYLPGRPLEEFPMGEQRVWFERLGEITAWLHGQTKASGGAKAARPSFTYESMIGKGAVWGDWRRVLGQISGAAGRHLIRADRLIEQRLRAYGVTQDNYGLIHGDLRGANLLVEEAWLKIIDFDDCGYGWYMQDLAASLSFLETEENVDGLIRAWCRGYRKRGILRKDDAEMIDTFIMMRRLQLLAWIGSRETAASAVRYGGRFLEGTVELSEKYLDGYFQHILSE